MKYEYRVKEAKDARIAEQIMYEMAKDGWRVISTIYWMNVMALIIITFEREIEE